MSYEATEPAYLEGTDPVLINISGKDTEPLWVQAWEVAAIGMYGTDDALVVMKGSGAQLVAKSIHPNEVAQMVAGVPSLGKVKDGDPEGR